MRNLNFTAQYDEAKMAAHTLLDEIQHELDTAQVTRNGMGQVNYGHVSTMNSVVSKLERVLNQLHADADREG